MTYQIARLGESPYKEPLSYELYRTTLQDNKESDQAKTKLNFLLQALEGPLMEDLLKQ